MFLMNKILHWAGAVSLMAALGFLTGCLKSPFARTEAKETDSTEMAVPVEVAPLRRGPIESVIKAHTHLEAESEVRVYARTANRVTELGVEEGDRVALDQVLLRLEDGIQTTQFERARNQLEKTRDEFQRSQALYDQELISHQTFIEIQYQLRQHELALADARRELEYTEVRAPIAGTVTRRLVKQGDLVNLNQHLFDLVDFDSIVARVYVPERELPRLTVGQPARVTASSLRGDGRLGRIQRIAPIVETRTGTVAVTIAFADVAPLLPGMYVEVEIVTARREDALLLSRRSLVPDGDLMFAYRLQTNRTVERVVVRPGIADPDHIEPAAGFQEGDLIVVAGQTGLRDGARVRLPGDPDPEAKEATAEAADRAPADQQDEARATDPGTA
jgi:membrane fusion protein, multidrug efflux system